MRVMKLHKLTIKIDGTTAGAMYYEDEHAMRSSILTSEAHSKALGLDATFHTSVVIVQFINPDVDVIDGSEDAFNVDSIGVDGGNRGEE